MRKFVLALLLTLIIGGGLFAQEPHPRDRFQDIHNYMVYYGTGRADELAQFDLVILQPDTLTTEELAALTAQGTLAIAYLSIGEAEPGREWYEDGRVSPAWELGTNENWGSRFMDANQPGWQDLMVSLAGESLGKGFQGVFLDTLDTVDVFPETKDGIVTIVQRLRDAYPDAIIVQNRGFTVLDQTIEEVDGLMFESLTTSYNFVNQAYILADNGFLAGELAELSAETERVILALDYVPPGNAARAANAIEVARSYGFVPAVSVIFLDDIPDYGLSAEPYADIQVNEIQVESDGEKTTLVISLENIGLADAGRVSLSLVIDGQQAESKSYDAVTSGEQVQWRYDWANTSDSASIRVTAYALDDFHAGNNTSTLAYNSDIVRIEPLLPPEEQRRRPSENGPDLLAIYIDTEITIDGVLEEWADFPCTDINSAEQISYGDPAGWDGADDLSASVCYGWDEDNLYVGFSVVDDVLVQQYTGTDLWRGDHVEIWFDTQLQLDFDNAQADNDDFQIGVSPGDFADVPPSFFIWTPAILPETYGDVAYAIIKTDTGYNGEICIPAEILTGLRLAPEHVISATFDPSDTDTPGSSDQELMLSTAPETLWGTPTLWNNLIFED